MSLIQLNEKILSSTVYLDNKYSKAKFNKFTFSKPKYQKLRAKISSYKAPGIIHNVNKINDNEIENETVNEDIDDVNESFIYQYNSNQEEE